MEELTPKQVKRLHLLFVVLKNTNDIPKPENVESSITPLYNWLESFENTEDLLE